MIAELDALGVSMTVVLCTGHFSGLRARRPLVEPDKILLGVLRGVSFEGRPGVLTPSERHVEPTTRRWREHGFDPVVVAASPYRHAAPSPSWRIACARAESASSSSTASA